MKILNFLFTISFLILIILCLKLLIVNEDYKYWVQYPKAASNLPEMYRSSEEKERGLNLIHRLDLSFTRDKHVVETLIVITVLFMFAMTIIHFKKFAITIMKISNFLFKITPLILIILYFGFLTVNDRYKEVQFSKKVVNLPETNRSLAEKEGGLNVAHQLDLLITRDNLVVETLIVVTVLFMFTMTIIHIKRYIKYKKTKAGNQ